MQWPEDDRVHENVEPSVPSIRRKALKSLTLLLAEVM